MAKLGMCPRISYYYYISPKLLIVFSLEVDIANKLFPLSQISFCSYCVRFIFFNIPIAVSGDLGKLIKIFSKDYLVFISNYFSKNV